MRAVLLLLLLVTLISIKTVAGGIIKKVRSSFFSLYLDVGAEKIKPFQSGSECTDWCYGNCVPSNGDCGPGFREGSCDQQTMKMKCRVPCKLKPHFGADCKYRFGNWGECDQSTSSQTKIGTLKRALNNAECEQTVSYSKPCPKLRRKPGKKRKGKGNSKQTVEKNL